MAEFTDANDRKWEVFIDIPTVKKLREHDLDVLNFFSGNMEVFEEVVGDPMKLVDTLWVVCRKQIGERGMDEEDFARGLYGDVLMSAAEALVEGICDFFPDPKRRASLKAVFRKTKEAESVMMDNAMARVEEMSVEDLVKAMETEFTKTSGGSQDTSG